MAAIKVGVREFRERFPRSWSLTLRSPLPAVEKLWGSMFQLAGSA